MDVFKNSFFPYVIDEWNKLKPEIRNVGSYLKFRKLILNLDNGHPISNPIIYLIQQVLNISPACDLNEVISMNTDCVNPLCSCSLKPESNSHFFLCCHHYTILRADLMNGLKKIDENILRLSENSLVRLLLFGDQKYNLIDNCHILNASINFVLRSERFKGSIMQYLSALFLLLFSLLQYYLPLLFSQIYSK